MTRWHLGAAVLAAALFLGVSGQVSATTLTCTTSDNVEGSTSFPGTSVTLGSGTTCIGAAPNTSGVTDNAVLSSTDNPEIYSFYYGGGTLTIEELLGNQGTSNDVYLELDSLSGPTSTTGTLVSANDSIQIPYQSGAGSTGSFTTDTLSAGYYAINTYLAASGSPDPQFELGVTGTPTVPEPGSALLLGLGLFAVGGLALARRRTLSF